MNGDGHVEVERRCPEPVVIWRQPWAWGPVWPSVEIDSFKAEPCTVLHLSYRPSDATLWDDPHRDQPPGIRRAVLLGQPFVVGVYDRMIGIVVTDRVPVAAPEHVSEEDLRVDTVLVLVVQS